MIEKKDLLAVVAGTATPKQYHIVRKALQDDDTDVLKWFDSLHRIASDPFDIDLPWVLRESDTFQSDKAIPASGLHRTGVENEATETQTTGQTEAELDEIDRILIDTEKLLRLERKDVAKDILMSQQQTVMGLSDQMRESKAKILVRTAQLLFQCGFKNEALATHQAVVELVKRLDLKAANYLFPSFSNQGSSLLDKKLRYRQAIPLLQYAIDCCGENMPNAKIQTLRTVGICLYRTHQHLAALEKFMEAIELFQQIKDSHARTYSAVGEALEFAAKANFAIGDFQNALACQQDFLEFNDRIHNVLNARVDIIRDLGMLATLADEMQLAEKALNDVLKTYNTYMSPFHKDLSVVYCALSICHLRRGELDEARRMLEKADDSYAKELVRYDDVFAAIRNNWGCLYFEKKLYQSAVDELEIAMQIPEDHLGMYCSREVLISNLAAAASCAGEYHRAIDLFKELHERLVASVGDFTTQFAIYLNNIGCTECDFGNVEVGIMQLERSLLLMSNAVGEHHSYYRIVKSNVDRLRGTSVGAAKKNLSLVFRT